MYVKRLQQISVFKSNFSLACLIFLVGFFTFSNTLNHDFVWDDHPLIDENPIMREVSSIKGFFTKDLWQNSPVNYESGFYRPLTLLSFFVNYQVWNGDPFGFHLLNVVLHALNAMLVFIVFCKLMDERRIAFFAAILFAVHPVQAEAVAFIADVGDLMCVFFILLAIYGYVSFVVDKKCFGCYVLSLISIFLALLCKENAMIGFVLIALTDFFFIAECKLKSFIRRLKILLPYCGVTAVYILLRIFVVGGDDALTTLSNVRYVSILPMLDWPTHILTVVKILIHYLAMFFWPIKQSISYVVLPEINMLTAENAMLVISVCVVLGVFIFSLKNHLSRLLFGLIFFFVCIVPLSNLIPISNTIAERFMYLPSIGLCFISACVIEKALRNKNIPNIFKFGLIGIGFGLLTFQTIKRNAVWENDYTLFKSAVGSSEPCAPIAHLNLNAYYNRAGDFDRAGNEYALYEKCIAEITQEYNLRKEIVDERN